MKLIHGGDVVGYREEYGREPLDFSANCNPLGMPPGVKAAAAGALEEAHRYRILSAGSCGQPSPRRRGYRPSGFSVGMGRRI